MYVHNKARLQHVCLIMYRLSRESRMLGWFAPNHPKFPPNHPKVRMVCPVGKQKKKLHLSSFPRPSYSHPTCGQFWLSLKKCSIQAPSQHHPKNRLPVGARPPSPPLNGILLHDCRPS